MIILVATRHTANTARIDTPFPHCAVSYLEGELFEAVPCERCEASIPPKQAPKQSGGKG